MTTVEKQAVRAFNSIAKGKLNLNETGGMIDIGHMISEVVKIEDDEDRELAQEMIGSVDHLKRRLKKKSSILGYIRMRRL